MLMQKIHLQTLGTAMVAMVPVVKVRFFWFSFFRVLSARDSVPYI